jgi:hypothetical protein
MTRDILTIAGVAIALLAALVAILKMAEEMP